MTIYEFLNTETARLPKKQQGSESFPNFLKIEYDLFQKDLSNKLDGETDAFSIKVLNNISFIKDLSDVIVKTVEEYYDGAPSRAYECFSEWLSNNRSSLEHLKTIEMEQENFLESYPLFRMRVHGKFGLSREQMFHIPFEQRHKVATQRYSIPGYPCLYLASSSYTCWKELGHPSFDNIYLVRLEPTQNINVLDLAYTPKFLSALSTIINSKPEYQDFFLYQVLFWPLKCACMIQCSHPEDPFKPEYIISQLLLQYIKNDEAINGIRYYSTCFDEGSNIELGCNYAFPVKTQHNSGYCKSLKELFNMTEVMPWQILSADRGRLPLSIRELKNYSSVINVVENEPVAYRGTIFGHMDDYGIRLDAKPL